MSAPEPSDRPGAFYGRRKGHPLRDHQASLMDTLLPKLAVDLAQPAPADLATLFPVPTRRFEFEIGFGGGEHLIHRAQESPETGFIGCEPFVNGMAKALASLEPLGLGNVRLYHRDAVELLDWLPDASLDRISILYPDPWRKARHWKRRFIRPDNLDRLARVLKPGGELRFASDWSDYVTWTLAQLRARQDFRWSAECAADWRRPYPGWPGTRYEAKALREGRVPSYLAFIRL